MTLHSEFEHVRLAHEVAACRTELDILTAEVTTLTLEHDLTTAAYRIAIAECDRLERALRGVLDDVPDLPAGVALRVRLALSTVQQREAST